MTDTKSKEDINLSADPFSEDHEVTMMDTLEEANEVTEKSFIIRTQPKVETPSQKVIPPPTPTPPKVPKPYVGNNSKINRIALVVTLPVSLLMFTLIVYFFNVILPEWTKPEKKPVAVTSPKKTLADFPEGLFGPQDHNIQLSELVVESDEVQAGNLPSVYIGKALKLHFSLTNWQIPPKDPVLNFHVSVKIFDSYGKLLHSIPNYKTFSEHAVAIEGSLLIENEILVLPNTEVGVYNVRFDVVDDSSQKAKTLQTQFRVLSRNKT